MKRQSKTGMFRFAKVDLVDQDQEGWMVAYADLITLLFVFFAVMLSISVVSRSKLQLLTQSLNKSATSSLMEIKKTFDQTISTSGLSQSVSTHFDEDGLKIEFSEKVLFESAKAELNPEGKEVLKKFLAPLHQAQRDFSIAIEGHTDSRPINTATFKSNWALSSARSVDVLHYLTEIGLSDRRFVVRAFADTRSVTKENKASIEVTKATVDSNAADRRVDLLIY